jgi:hypothetical protein
MKQTVASIRKTKKALRKIIEDPSTPIEKMRMAYYAETTLTWATEDTVDWLRPENDLDLHAEILSKEIQPIEIRILKLLIAAGLVSEEKAEQARKLALSLKW